MKTQLTAIVKGKVQGVGFRATTKLIAEKLQLTGFVRNLSNGDVEICAQGEKEILKQLLVELRKAFPSHYIEHIDFDFKPVETQYDSFKIE